MEDIKIYKRFKLSLKFYKISRFISFLAGGVLGYITFGFNFFGLILFLILAFIYICIIFIFWKCPECNKVLPILKRPKDINSCSNCGVDLLKK